MEANRRFGGFQGIRTLPAESVIRLRIADDQGDNLISEMQIHTIARQMFERYGATAIAQAAQNAIACEQRGEAEEAREWRHLEDAMKMMRGPHQS